jgi:hypothetical protein
LFGILGSILLFVGAADAAEFKPVECSGKYKQHLQGVCTSTDSIFWCFTTKLVKTDLTGKVLAQIDVGSHHGDLCYNKGNVYVAVNFGKFNRADGDADSWVYVYRANDLSLAAKHPVPDVFHGAGGIAYHDGKFIIVGGLPPGIEENYAYEYDQNFKLVKKHVLQSGYTLMGIQTAAFADGCWWFGCYGKPQTLLKADESLQKVERFEFDCSVGIVPIGGGRFLVGRNSFSQENGHAGRLILAETDEDRGLKMILEPTP